MREKVERFLKRLLGSRPGPPRRRIHYQVACSLDGYIAGPDGDAEWIVHDPAIDFGELFDRFDTVLMGRRTYEAMSDVRTELPGFDVVVFSRTLHRDDHPDVTVVSDHVREALAELRARPGKDIWLFGGGELFRSLMEMDEVDVVELAIVPVLLGGGTPLFPAPAGRRFLSLESYRSYPSGIVLVEYSVRSR